MQTTKTIGGDLLKGDYNARLGFSDITFGDQERFTTPSENYWGHMSYSRNSCITGIF